jgi:hypothetical protein
MGIWFKTIVILGCAALLLVAARGEAQGQDAKGTLSGSVSERGDGSPLAGITVIATSGDSKKSNYSTVTDAKGNFRLSGGRQDGAAALDPRSLEAEK